MDFTYITVLDFNSGMVYQYNLTDVGDNYLFEDKDEPQAEAPKPATPPKAESKGGQGNMPF